MNDFVFVLISVAFFALAAGYAWFCERLDDRVEPRLSPRIEHRHEVKTKGLGDEEQGADKQRKLQPGVGIIHDEIKLEFFRTKDRDDEVGLVMIKVREREGEVGFGELGFVKFVVEDVWLAESHGEEVGDLGDESAFFSGEGESDAETFRAHGRDANKVSAERQG